MQGDFKDHLTGQLDGIRDAGLYKNERQITTPQGARVGVSDGSEVINLCANNYWFLCQFCENMIFSALWGRDPDLRDGSKWRLQTAHCFGIRGSVL